MRSQCCATLTMILFRTCFIFPNWNSIPFLPSPAPLNHSIFCLCDGDYPKGIIYYLYFGDWFISLTIMLLRLIHVIIFVRIFFLFCFEGWMIFHCRYIQYFVYSFFYSLMSHPVWCDISSLWHLGDVGHISKLAINPTGSLSHFLILLCPHPPACLACSLILATVSAVASSASFHGQRILLQGLVSAPQGSPIPFMMQNVAGSGFSPSYYFPCVLYFVLCLVPDDVYFLLLLFTSECYVFGIAGMLLSVAIHFLEKIFLEKKSWIRLWGGINQLGSGKMEQNGRKWPHIYCWLKQ